MRFAPGEFVGGTAICRGPLTPEIAREGPFRRERGTTMVVPELISLSGDARPTRAGEDSRAWVACPRCRGAFRPTPWDAAADRDATVADRNIPATRPASCPAR